MTILRNDETPDTVLKFSESLNISGADTMHRALLDAIQAPTGLVLDLAGVERCDAAAAQLLCATRSTAVGCGKRFRVASISEAVVEAFAKLGLPLEELAEFDPQTAEGPQHAA